jgi:lysophospholipase L1-like esterase
MIKISFVVAVVLLVSCNKLTPPQPSFKKVVMMGDSQIKQIEGGYTGIKSSWNEVLEMDNIVNEGHNGYMFEEMYKGIDGNVPLQQAINHHPDYVYLMGGTNESLSGEWDEIESPKKTIYWLDKICKELEVNNIPFSIHLPVPFTKSKDSAVNIGGILNYRIEKISKVIEEYCCINNIECIDLKPFLCYKDEITNRWFLTDKLSFDGIHFNLGGYEMWKKPLLCSMNNKGLFSL